MKNKINRKLNVIILISIMMISLLVLILEDYLKISLAYKPFLVFSGIISIFNFYVILFQISTKRLISLIPIAGTIGYVTQMVGTGCNIWIYTNHGKTFYIAIFMFILVGIAMYGITNLMLSLYGKHELKKTGNKIFNICWVSGIFIFLVVTSLKFKNDINLQFWVYYIFLFAFAIYSSTKTNLTTIIAITISAWIMGFASEYFGSQAGIWIFEKTNNFPPSFLVWGSWPLEFTFYYGVSAMIAREEI